MIRNLWFAIAPRLTLVAQLVLAAGLAPAARLAPPARLTLAALLTLAPGPTLAAGFTLAAGVALPDGVAHAGAGGRTARTPPIPLPIQRNVDAPTAKDSLQVPPPGQPAATSPAATPPARGSAASARASGASPHPAEASWQPRTVRADVVLTYEREDHEGGSVEAYLSAERPDRMRITAHLGLITAFELTARGDSFWVAVPHYDAELAGRKDEVRVSPLDPARLAQALFLDPLAGPDGRPRGERELAAAAETAVTDPQGSWLSGRDSLGGYRLRRDVQGRPVLFTRARPDGTPFLEISFEDYRGVPGGQYPGAIRWHDLDLKQRLSMEFDDIRLNTDLVQARFGPPREKGMRVIPWKSWEAVFSAEP